MGNGLIIHTVAGDTIEIHGNVTMRETPEDGLVYYCAGLSFPAEIVVEVLTNGEPLPVL